MEPDAVPPPTPADKGIRRGYLLAILLVALGVAATLVFYAEENWRGKHGWEQCKRELEAKGERLDWAAYIPPPIPADENIFKTPRMTEWFVGKGTNQLSQRLNPHNFYEFARQRNSNLEPIVIAVVTVVPSEANLDLTKEEAVVRYFDHGRAFYVQRLAPGVSGLARSGPVSQGSSNAVAGVGSKSNLIRPSIVLEELYLSEAIGYLAQADGIRYELDSTVRFAASSNSPSASGPTLSACWLNATASEVLDDLLDHYNLQWADDQGQGRRRITSKDPAAPLARGYPSLQEELGKMVHKAIGPGAAAPQGFTLVESFGHIRPAQVATLISSGSKRPAAHNVLALFPTNDGASKLLGPSRFQVKQMGTNSFRILLDRSQIFTTADYLAWSEQFQPDFEAIKLALGRSFARMEGDYEQPARSPLPNSLAFRLVSEILAQRALSLLLLDRPEEALHELTLLHELARLLELKPNHRPISLVAAMAEAQLSRAYCSAVAEGLRLHAWQERQIAAIEKQVHEINLPEMFSTGLRADRACLCRTILAAIESRAGPSQPAPQRTAHGAGDHSISQLPPLPQGWTYDKLANTALDYQRMIDAFDPPNRTIFVEHVKAWESELPNSGFGVGPVGSFIALLGPQNMGRAARSIAQDQTLAAPTLIACALEAYYSQEGKYPERLDQLSPTFLTRPPSDPINAMPMKYRRINTTRFLLYSVGWNATDDGGVPSDEPNKGDWVWGEQ